MAPLVHYAPPAPVPTEYRVGLCAWQDKSMVDEGTFYPIKSMKAEERLWWYSRFFDCVEVNSTFYAPLSAQNAVLWAKRTPPGFLFSVKAYALLTGHHLDAGRLPEPLAGMLPAAATANARGRIDNAVFPAEAREWAFATFREALQPLADAGKLGYVLFQMAPWFRHGRRRSTISRRCPSGCPGSPSPSSFATPRGCRATPTRCCASWPSAGSPTSRWTRRAPPPTCRATSR